MSAEDSPSCLLRLLLTLCSNWIVLFIGVLVFVFPYLESFCFCLCGSRHAAFCCMQAASALIAMAQMKPNSSRATAVMVFLCSLPRAISVM
jgi:hypothetical protein